MTNNYLLKDLDEFKIRYVKNRIKDELYALDNDNYLVLCYRDEKTFYNHKFIVTDNKCIVSNKENILMCRRLKEENIFEIVTIPSTLDKTIISNAKKNLDRYMHKFNEMLTYLSLDKDCISYKDDDYLSWFFAVDQKELDTIRKIYFYDKSIVPYEDVDIKEAKLEYEVVPYSTIDDFEIDSIEPNNRMKNIITDIHTRQNKSKIKAKTIYTK